VRYDRRLLLAVLVYVMLDLSLPAMPGAFVFEPSDSVETARMHRGHAAGDGRLLTALLQGSPLLVPQRIDGSDEARPAGETGRAMFCVVSRLPRAALAPAPASEDPQ